MEPESNQKQIEESNKTAQSIRVFRIRPFTMMGLLFIIIGLTLIFFREIIVYHQKISFETLLNFSPYVMIAFGVFYIIYSYLISTNPEAESSTKTYTSVTVNPIVGDKLDKIIQLIEEQIKKESILASIDFSQENVSKELANAMAKNLSMDFFQSLKSSIVSQISEDKKLAISMLSARNDDSVIRLKNEISRLNGSATLNLAVGSTITIAALSLLGWFILHENFNSIDIKTLAMHFLPRLSLVVFIEFFSFFFLRLYRSSLQEVKYYQNELTNLESKSASMLFTANYGNAADVSIILKELILTERNFKLQKDESTVELERNKAESETLKEVLKASLEAYKKGK